MGDGDSTSGTSTGAQHALPTQKSLYVAPTDGSAAFNTIRIPLLPVACWRLGDPAFDFDSSFVLPTFGDELATLSRIVQANAGCPAAIFAHADPAGGDELNKTISDRRAIAIYALLTRQPPMWEELYSNPVDGDKWGTRAIQAMLQTVVGRASDDNGNSLPANSPYYAGDIDGKAGPETKGAVKQFQTDSGLSADGDAGPNTRKVLFGAYMDVLCTPSSPPSSAMPADAAAPPPSPPSTPAPFRMKSSDFLGGASAADGDLPKMSLQGCSRFNPLVLLTSDEMTGSDKATRNAHDAPNRRVVLFFFPSDTKADASKWPCPKVKDPMDACKSVFWSDGDTRRKNGDALRDYRKTPNTMACRFYDRFARRSPCEIGLTLNVWLQDRQRQRMPSAPYRLTVGGTARTGTASAEGLVTEAGLPLKMQGYIEWGETTPDPSTGVAIYPYARMLALDIEADPQNKSLANLAYNTPQWDLTRYDMSDPPSSKDMLAAFQKDYPSNTPHEVNTDGTPKKASKKASA